MELEDECDAEVVTDGPDTEPLDLGFETELVEDVDSTANVLDCREARDFEEEVVLDSEDEMSRGMEQVDVANGLFRKRTNGRVRADEVELKFDVIPADESGAGETRSQELWHELDLVQPTDIGSNEPGDSSEAHALNFVENFLLLSNMDLSPETHLAKKIKEKSPAFPRVMGIRDVAKRISSSSSIQGAEIFEWVDTSYRKEATFNCGRYRRTCPEKHREKMKSQSKRGDASASESLENAELVNNKSQNIASVSRHLESVRHGLNVDAEKVDHEHLVDFDLHLNGETSECLLSSAVLGEQTEEAFDVGFCTQMAAEAMEALSHAASSSSPLFNQDPQSTYNTYREDERDRIAHLNKSSQMVHLCSKSQLHAKNLRTSTSSSKHPKRQRPDATLETQKKVKTESSLIKKSARGENFSRSKIISGSSTDSKRQRRDLGAMKLEIMKDVDGHVGLSPTISSRKRQSHNNSVDLNPLSPSNRQFISGARLNMAKDSVGITGALKDICTPGFKMVKFSSNHDRFKDCHRVEQRGLISDATEMAKNRTVNNQEKAGSKIDLLGFLSGLGTWKYPRGKRMYRNSRGIRNDDYNLHTAIAGKRNGNKPRKFISRTDVSFSNNDLRTKLHQVARGNSPNKMEGGLVMQKSSQKSVMLKELTRLGITESLPVLTWKDLRKRRYMAFVRVLFSLHLDHDIVMQQNKILKRLGISNACSSEDATHFIADRFVRTRNMLEAIARGKPVVTHLWLESCEQAGCLIDERNFILRDGKKEKELGFNMAASLANARQYPILKGKKVFITTSVKPSKEMLISLVKAVHGQAIQRNQVPITEDGIIPDEVLIISCEEDQTVWAPLLRKGGKIYSTELILSGVVTQKLEYERHELFKANVWTGRSSTKLIKNKKALGP